MPRIIYISTRESTPAGGIKVIFQHVQGLRELGYDAYVGHPETGFRPQWFDADIPILYYLDNMKVHREDIFVIPETGFNTLRLLKGLPVRKVMFCQNWHGVRQGLGEAGHWRDFGIQAVMTCSEVVAECARSAFGYPLTHSITCPIDHQVFKPAAKRRQIAFMPRKRRQDVAEIQFNVRLLAPDCPFDWLPIDGMSQGDVARALAESAIFLSLSRREGLGLPPLEAMAAGCLVTGFTGGGGLEYASSDNGLWCREDDPFDCANQLAAACRILLAEPTAAGRLVAGGMATAGRFNFDQMKRDLASFWPAFQQAFPAA